MGRRPARILLGLLLALCAAPVAHAGDAATIEPIDCDNCTIAEYAAKLAAANPQPPPATFADYVAWQRQQALVNGDDGTTLADLTKQWEDAHPSPPPSTFSDYVALERQHEVEGQSSDGGTIGELAALWEAAQAPATGGDPGSGGPPSNSAAPAQPDGGWFSGGGYAADGFKQIDFRSSDGTTIQVWASPDGATTVTETHTSDGTTSTVVRDDSGNEIYSSITDAEGKTTSTTDGVTETVTSTNDTGTGGDDPGSSDSGDGSGTSGDGSGTATAFVGADDATGGTLQPPPAGFAAPASEIRLAPSRIDQLGHPTNDGGDDSAAGPLQPTDNVIDPIDGPPDSASVVTGPLPVRGAGPEFGPDGPTTDTGPYVGPSTGPISQLP